MQCDMKKTNIIKKIRINNSNSTQTIQNYRAKTFLGKVKAYGRMAGKVLHVQHMRQTEDFAP